MKTLTLQHGQKLENLGTCILTYSDPGWGKSGALGTLEDPIAIVYVEPRDPRIALSWCKKRIKFFMPQGFDETEDLLHQMEISAKAGKFNFRSVGFDSLSFAQSSFKTDLEDFRYDVNMEKDGIRGFGERFMMTEKDWGPLGSAMKRITAALNRLSQYGIVVVANATPVEHPKWNRALRAAPAFQGKDYGGVFNGYFDFIFYILEPVKILQDGSILPPKVAFHSPMGDFVAKCCNNELLRKETGPLDYERILRIIRRSAGEGKEVVVGKEEVMKKQEAEVNAQHSDSDDFMVGIQNKGKDSPFDM